MGETNGITGRQSGRGLRVRATLIDGLARWLVNERAVGTLHSLRQHIAG